jgi:hypothetical protein
MVCAIAMPAHADDRPFLTTSNAVADEDDDGVWSFETWATQLPSLRTLSVAPEYAFDPTTNLQLVITRLQQRDIGGHSSTVELEFKHLFNHIGRDGYGVGFFASLSTSRPDAASWHGGELQLKLPVSLSLWDGEGLLHLNPGYAIESAEKRTWTASAALQRDVGQRAVVFAEWARDSDARFVHAGVRWWVKRGKVAFDTALQRRRFGGPYETGVVLGLAWYDL